MLLDRLPERAALSQLLDAARAGRSGVLVMRGEPGVGKTALLEYAIESAAGLRVARVAGVESEMELAFAALQQLCAPMLDKLAGLPNPQRDALGVAFGLTTGAAPDRFLVGLAALSLLSEVAEQQPLLCVIDDAQWLDRASAQALAFVARRLLAEPVALVFATREQGEEYRGLPELPVEGLRDGDAHQLLSSVIMGPLDERVRDRIVAETRGNPLALLELPRGVPGVGKTALLDYAIESAAGLRVARVAGVESEMELAFAALQQLCAPMLDQLAGLPDPQRAALGVAFGLNTGAAPDRFLVGLAALSLLSEVAEQQPLLCVIDDAQWLDRASAQALAFVARRLLAEPVALVFATREPGEEFRGLPELLVGGLRDGDARELLSSVIRGPLDERVRDRIVAETRGNPLALLELPRGDAADCAGGSRRVPGAVPGLPGRIEDSFRRRLEVLPAATQRLMLVAAAEPAGEPALVWRAAERLGIGAEAVAPAADAGLLTIGERVTFRHPLVRSAVYRAASPAERRAAHQALADATDPQADPDRRAWHRAQATLGPDEDVASELERSASRAQARGGLAAAAAFLERSAALTLDPARRAERALAAAQAKYQAGAFDATLGLLATAEAGPPDQLRRARADLLRGQIAFSSSRGSDAPPLLLKAARQFEPLDPRLARETYLDALAAATFAGRLALGGGMREVAEAARMAPPPPGPRAGPICCWMAWPC